MPAEVPPLPGAVGLTHLRGRAVVAFNDLRRALDTGDRTPLDMLLDQAAALVSVNHDTWRTRWEQGAKTAAARTGDQLTRIAAGDAAHLRDASVHRLDPPGPERNLGCCGTLGTYVPH